jgi:prophage regulatory protein
MQRTYVFADKVEQLVGLDRSTLWRNERIGLFPKRFVIGRRRVAWDLGEINAWIEQQKAARPNGDQPAPRGRRRSR